MALIEHPPSVVLLVQEGDQLVAVRQQRAGAQGDVLELPAGTCEPGETVVECADRELAEECGLAVAGWTVLGSFLGRARLLDRTRNCTLRRAVRCSRGKPDDDEEITVERVPAETAHDHFEDGTSLAALTLWASKPV